MYHNGFIKIELSNPDLHIGDPFKNAESILEVLNRSKASLVLFPELFLSSYTAGDLFFETTFYQEVLESLQFIMEKTTFEGVYLVGMPFFLKEVLFNVAVVIQKDKILGIVPKHTIPNYKEFSEKRWFHSGKTIQTQEIYFLGQKVPVGNILFINKKFDISFGVEICQDLWTIESPSDLLALNGAELIFNLSSSTEHIGKKEMRKNAVINHSRKHIGGYFYTSSGITESSTDVLFSNHKIAAVFGNLIGEKDLFNQDDTSLVVDVYIDSIKYQRRIDTTLGDQKIGKEFPFFKSYFDIKEHDNYEFEKPFHQKPFVEMEDLEEQLKLANHIQFLSLQSKLSHIKNVKVILKLASRLNELLSLLAVVQSFQASKKTLDHLIVIMEDEKDSQPDFVVLMKNFLNNLGIKNILLDNEDHQPQVKEWLSKELIHHALSKFTSNPLMLDDSQILVLESDNLSDTALGKVSERIHYYDQLYNVNVGLTQTFMTELILFHLNKPIISIPPELKAFYQEQIEKFLTPHIVIEDFILYHHLKNNFSKAKIAFLIEHTFALNAEESLVLVQNYLKTFYQTQYKRQQMSPGPKILENSLSPRTEFKLPINFQRKE
ncbi:nitrilase-related carbon-nitrogen hydrolase [Candidatus Phytoplasma meliae]|uniref:Glutamine-dependent NAD(+) synthetase n=1 Tax=Candidatus Phytoplasma meliae TaxID=1848402 RepID=A0ABS5CYE0_9MOLU|nr:nitrilase-related carbon-nitrogen hydrolase [Candidatus Phytoplasma meliae]MBP5835997.1 NAD+ synthetase [Candidatus Phytoplasma meliae]